MSSHEIENLVKAYYEEKILKFGPTPMGVDWNGEQSQHTRFQMLFKQLKIEPNSKILDFGCGYGEMLNFIKSQGIICKYQGYDIVKVSIEVAEKLHRDTEAKFVSTLADGETWDYILMSGVFNVKGILHQEAWTDYVISQVEELLRRAERGISFNLLTSFNDMHLRKDHLYYADPRKLLSKIVIDQPFVLHVDHSYPLWEYTVTILK